MEGFEQKAGQVLLEFRLALDYNERVKPNTKVSGRLLLPRKGTMMKTTLYLIRHGEAAGNKNRTFQGRVDAPLTDHGRLQLKDLAERFRTVNFDEIYSSPLQRAYETAQAVNTYHHKTIHLEPGIIELDGGQWEGVHLSQLAQASPELMDAWINHLQDFQAPGGESFRQVYDRVRETIQRLIRENPGKTLVLVGHGCSIKTALCYCKGLPLEQLQDMPWCDNTGVTKVEFDEQGHPTILYENDSSHLSPQAKSIVLSRHLMEEEP